MDTSFVRLCQRMYYNENLTIGEIASALRVWSQSVYEAIYKMPIIIDLE